jgi:prepilin-type N-terminal cleavage/methylation domain-containing protein
MRKAFTLIEMVVALGILALILSFAGVIFRVSIESQRLALANAEIMQKYRAITEQLDADFRGLCRDGEIFVAWSAARKNDFTGANRNDPAAFDRFDRIMFFTSGDFQTYLADPMVRGNVARVCYTLARGPSPSANPADPNRAVEQKPPKRILARTQHILVPPAGTATTQLDTTGFTDAQWLAWNSEGELDRISLAEWKQMPLAEKVNTLSVVGDMKIELDDGTGTVVKSTIPDLGRGVLVDRTKPATLVSLLCAGVGQFMIQGWNGQRWVPEVNPDGDNDLTDDSDFLLQNGDIDPVNIPAVWYPRGGLTLGGGVSYPFDEIDEAHFDAIPGLGRALKFTFTLYDSRGLLQNGRVFTHIVYLDM